MSKDAKNVVDSMGMPSFMKDIVKEKIDEDNMVVGPKEEIIRDGFGTEFYACVERMGGVVLTVKPTGDKNE